MVNSDKIVLEVAQMTYYTQVKGGKWEELSPGDKKKFLDGARAMVELLDKQNYVVITKKEYDKHLLGDSALRENLKAAIDKWVGALRHPRNIRDWVKADELLEVVWKATNR